MTPAYDKEPQHDLLSRSATPHRTSMAASAPATTSITDAIVAIDATTGKTKWYYQTIPHDVWDLDAVSPPVVTMLDGKKVVVHAGKTGWLYVVDAATGKLVRKSQNFVPQENMFALPTEKGTRMLPGANGGSEWSPIAVDPEPRLRLRGRTAPADELHHPLRTIREGPALARLGVRGHPR